MRIEEGQGQDKMLTEYISFPDTGMKIGIILSLFFLIRPGGAETAGGELEWENGGYGIHKDFKSLPEKKVRIF